MKICPLCNKMYEPKFQCANCSTLLSDKGRIEEYLGPYSADMPIENAEYCNHIYKCSVCGRMENHSIEMINY